MMIYKKYVFSCLNRVLVFVFWFDFCVDVLNLLYFDCMYCKYYN